MKSPRTLRTLSCLSLYLHRNLAGVEDVEKGLPVLFAKGAVVPRLLTPSVEVSIGGKSVEGHI